MTPRVAFFTDSFHETNGVALTSRQFDQFAQERSLPFLSVHAGPRTQLVKRGPFGTLELANSRAVLSLEHDLQFDLAFLRHRPLVTRTVAAFRPDLIHITGPGHLGMLGALVAHQLGIPLAASWHTNVHEYLARRMMRLLRHWPPSIREHLSTAAERYALAIAVKFYGLARVLFAPNPELAQMLESRLGRPVWLMERGVDTTLFSPERRRADGQFVIGYVGRLSPEKNVRMLASLERLLVEAGVENYRFLIIGEGNERGWLRSNLRSVEAPGVLIGEPLADAYADMDVFVFPSETDTFGNVVLEAMASGVPPVVSAQGGPKFLVHDARDGFVAGNLGGFAGAVLALYRHPELLATMKTAARAAAETRSWASVFDSVYNRYQQEQTVARSLSVPGRPSCRQLMVRKAI